MRAVRPRSIISVYQHRHVVCAPLKALQRTAEHFANHFIRWLNPSANTLRLYSDPGASKGYRLAMPTGGFIDQRYCFDGGAWSLLDILGVHMERVRFKQVSVPVGPLSLAFPQLKRVGKDVLQGAIGASSSLASWRLAGVGPSSSSLTGTTK